MFRLCPRIITFIFLLVVIQSCSSSKVNKLLNQGSKGQDVYTKSILLEMENGFIILPVEINNKKYRFILDTGSSSNIISPKLAKELDLNPLGSESISDFFEQTKELAYAEIDNIKIAGIDFNNTITAIHPFDNNQIFSCLNVDGFIGSNLLQLSVWDLDFPNNKITFSNDESFLKLPEEYKEARLYIGAGGVPSITSKVNNKKILNTTIDLGFTGTFVLSDRYFNRQRKKNSIEYFVEGFGSTLVGIYGENIQYTFYKSRINKLEVGDFEVIDQVAHK